jgi:hypothetical protein
LGQHYVRSRSPVDPNRGAKRQPNSLNFQGIPHEGQGEQSDAKEKRQPDPLRSPKDDPFLVRIPSGHDIPRFN